jgi:hypothetical protein
MIDFAALELGAHDVGLNGAACFVARPDRIDERVERFSHFAERLKLTAGCSEVIPRE